MLAAELTHHVVQAKALAAGQGQWPKTLPNLSSQACPGEQWEYQVSPQGQMSLSFSYDFSGIDSALQKDNPLIYQSNLAQ